MTDSVALPTEEQPRNWPEDFSHENGKYQCRCSTCGSTFLGHKRRVTCKVCAQPAPDDVTRLQRVLEGVFNDTLRQADALTGELVAFRPKMIESAEWIRAQSLALPALVARCREAETADEVAWLVERQKPGYSEWWDGIGFTDDASAVVRFSRQEDAERLIAANAHAMLAGCRATEHMWVGGKSLDPITPRYLRSRLQEAERREATAIQSRDVEWDRAKLARAERAAAESRWSSLSDSTKAVVEAWTNGGPHPEFHREAQADLARKWPALAKAVAVLSLLRAAEGTK